MQIVLALLVAAVAFAALNPDAAVLAIATCCLLGSLAAICVATVKTVDRMFGRSASARERI